MHTWLSLDLAVVDRVHDRQHAAEADRRLRHHLAARANTGRHTGPRHEAARGLRWLAARLDPSLASELRLGAAPSSR